MNTWLMLILMFLGYTAMLLGCLVILIVALYFTIGHFVRNGQLTGHQDKK